MEQFSNKENRLGETVLEIDLGALAHNYHYFKKRLRPTTKFLGVVKAFAYGSDSIVVAKCLEDLGIDYLAVAYLKEGMALREAGIKLPILVLHPLPISFEDIIKHDLEPSLYSPKILEKFLLKARELKKKAYPVHLKFNTGLNRLGLQQSDIKDVARQLNESEEIKMVSVFSHLAASEDMNEKEFTLGQIERFCQIMEEVTLRLKSRPFRHILNTSGIINYPEAQFEMVRSGIGLYGFGNDARIDGDLQPVATLKTVISQIHDIEPGESIGYNRAFISDRPKKTATLPLGHADGIGRQYGGGNTYVTINGQSALIIGNVCMDMIMVDITNIPCEVGDEVIVFGADPTAEQFARTASTISYEILTGISQRVKRVIR
ncbi:alanine racemase [Pareuzebyella sediminis]|uniref:alanine racemase n=1 Tax=Pareuzebyella sediminis TaxID=2607998 RepID=UPI0011EF06C1|nr:alanine racemase [Pareuzebyella sediminis]